MFRTVTAAVVFVLAGSGVRADVAERVRNCGVAGGIVVHVGCGDGCETLKARLDVDGGKVQEARKNILAAGLYGAVTARCFDGKELPYVDNLVNLVIADDAGRLSRDEIMRVLVPGGTEIIEAYGPCAPAMTQTTLIAGLSMLAFALSAFQPVAQFGLLMFILLVAALVGDLIFLPALLATRAGESFVRWSRTAKHLDRRPLETAEQVAPTA